ncbi:MAG: hypothetical protein V3576_02030, partial [Candidatus Cloacimonadota bacterium]
MLLCSQFLNVVILQYCRRSTAIFKATRRLIRSTARAEMNESGVRLNLQELKHCSSYHCSLIPPGVFAVSSPSLPEH